MRSLTRLVTTAAAASLIAIGYVGGCACGGTQKPGDDDDQTEPPPAAGQDVVFEDYEPLAIQGTLYQPQALGLPGIIRVSPKGKTVRLAAQRKKVANLKKRDKVNEQQVQFLVTALWDASKKNAEKAEELRTEMKDELTALLDADKLKKDISMANLAAVTLILGDEAKAAELYAKGIETFPDSERLESMKTWLAYLQLRANQNDEAKATFDGVTVDTPEEQYVAAWLAFRSREGEAARDAIKAAAKGWKNRDTAPAVVDDMILFTGWATADEARALFDEVGKQNADATHIWLSKAADLYASLGRFDQSIAALDGALEVLGEEPPASVQLRVRFQQANYELRQNHPAEAAQRFLDAAAAVEACKEYNASADAKPELECTQPNMDAVPENIAKVAQLLHTVYATTMDEDYYEPAKKLYDAYLAYDPPRADAGTIEGYAKRLEETKQNAQPGTGKHDAERMGEIVSLRHFAIRYCYETYLQADPSIAGTLTVSLNANENGEVTLVETEPKAGDAGMAAVAKCAVDEVSGWTFPGRGQPGTTAVVYPFELSRAE